MLLKISLTIGVGGMQESGTGLLLPKGYLITILSAFHVSHTMIN